MTTAVIRRAKPAHARPQPADTAGTWDLDRSRCAVGVDLDLPGATIWRARLRPLAAHLSGTTLTANLSVRPLLASAPLTRGLFLRRIARTARIWLEAEGDLLAAGPGDAVGLAGEISAGSRSWPVQIAARRTTFDDERMLLTLVGRLVTPTRTFPGTQVRFEAVAEFVRCA